MDFWKNSYFCFIEYPKAFNCVDHKKLWKFFKEMRISDHRNCLPINLYAGQEATVITLHGTANWERSMKRLYFNLYAYLTYMQNTSCEMPGWMNHKLQSGLQREISTALDMQMIPL